MLSNISAKKKNPTPGNFYMCCFYIILYLIAFFINRLISIECSSGTLRDLMNHNLKHDWQKDLAGQIINGIHYLHMNNICHCALKPSNIVFSNENSSVLKLTNFGFAHVTKTGNLISLWKHLISSGTSKSWLAPEAYFENKFTKEMDMYAIGLLLGFIFSNGRRHVFDAKEKKIRSKEDRITRMKTNQPMTLTLEHLGNVPDATVAFNLIVALLNYEPCLRPTASILLRKHPIFFKDVNKRSSSQTSASCSVRGSWWFTFNFK